MFSIAAGTPIYVLHGAVDFRRGLESLVGLCRSDLFLDPYSGAIFIFRNKKMNSLKLIFFDGTGLWLCTKRLSEGKFYSWPDGSNSLSVIQAREFLVLVSQGDMSGVKFQKMWNPLAFP